MMSRALTLKEERGIAESLSPIIAWPTLRLALLLPLAQALLIGAALSGYVPVWAVILPLGYIVFASYTGRRMLSLLCAVRSAKKMEQVQSLGDQWSTAR